MQHNSIPAAMLRREGVNFLQGYYFGRPALEKPWLIPSAQILGAAS